MKRLTILPGAAGIIALTATIGFVDGQREVEAENFSREKISLVLTMHNNVNAAGVSAKVAGAHETIAYLVEFKRGDKAGRILIDAATGKVILS
ncbi:MAG: PepSY domain-containing protein [Gallionella sp.]